ncbi:deaminase [Sinosporangium siamense]|uniref:CMP/dCMP-type deaminase domain-containing protein n=1 Tax=Sinosporangium siamense TaxID=1367973 RepID=A0A919V5R9_9ACTN|nr:deaminase [Sinosporangium siamense]GII91788.1 hypothetical protein Ssi02_20190 [Sinosporangium siamense]
MNDHDWLTLACELARSCPPSETAFSVGVIVVAHGGKEMARGFSRESDPLDHAEEAALAKIDPADPRLPTATVYSSLEPCGKRKSRPQACARLIVGSGIRRVVMAWREPDLFVEGRGAEVLSAAGVVVVEMPELADLARKPNAHLVP